MGQDYSPCPPSLTPHAASLVQENVLLDTYGDGAASPADSESGPRGEAPMEAHHDGKAGSICGGLAGPKAPVTAVPLAPAGD